MSCNAVVVDVGWCLLEIGGCTSNEDWLEKSTGVNSSHAPRLWNGRGGDSCTRGDVSCRDICPADVGRIVDVVAEQRKDSAHHDGC